MIVVSCLMVCWVRMYLYDNASFSYDDCRYHFFFSFVLHFSEKINHHERIESMETSISRETST